MRTQFQFISDDFPPYPGEDDEINPGIWGKRLAEYIVSNLAQLGVETDEIYAEDWGWEIPVPNAAFPIFIGCGNQTEPGSNKYLCLIEPSKPKVRVGLFKKVSTEADVSRVADALDSIFATHPGVRDFAWVQNDT